MKFTRILVQDIRYQMRYGFYLLYAFVSLIYIGILRLIPVTARTEVATLIILSDPALLGFFFIGGIWLLEQGEGLHRYWSVLPAKPYAYIGAKLLSLGFISTLSGLLITGISGVGGINYPLLVVTLLLSAGIFTLAGLVLATMARTVNHYLVLTIPVEIGILLPPLLLLCGLHHPLLLLFPGTQGLAALRFALGLERKMELGLILAGLLFWLGIAFGWAYLRVPMALREGGNGS